MPGNTYREMFERQRASSQSGDWFRWLDSFYEQTTRPRAEQLGAQADAQRDEHYRQDQEIRIRHMTEVTGMQAEALGQQAAINRLLRPTQGQFGSLTTRTGSLRRSQVAREQFMKVGNTGFAKWSKQIELETMC